MTARLKILIATTNRGKAGEFADLLPFEVDLVTLADLGIAPPEETGATFQDNARLKALEAARASGLITIADDSGLCVDALAGAPGIRSARYAGEDASDAENRRKLLGEIADVPSDRRGAHFEACVVVAHDNVIIAEGIGRTYGSIAAAERGSHGFGYDPIFQIPDGRTMAELPAAMKNEISHRSKATRQIIPALDALITRLRPADVRSL
jgi:XTP/dITP diphosphohydrolase